MGWLEVGAGACEAPARSDAYWGKWLTGVGGGSGAKGAVASGGQGGAKFNDPAPWAGRSQVLSNPLQFYYQEIGLLGNGRKGAGMAGGAETGTVASDVV